MRRIYNLGGEGQGTLQHLSRLKEALEGKRMRPGNVLWAFYPNDPSDDRRFLAEKEQLQARTILQTWSAWLQRHLPLYYWMRHSLRAHHPSPETPPFLRTYQDELKHAGNPGGYPTLAKAVVSHWYSVRMYGEANSNQSRQDWALTETGLNQAWELLQTRDIPMTLVYMTPQLLLIEEECRKARPELFGTQPAEDFREALETWSRTHHVPLLDPTDAFRKAQQRGEILYWVRDGHWNTRGNEVLADWLKTALQKGQSQG